MAVRLYNRLSQAFPKRAIVRLDADDTQEKTQPHLVSVLKQLGATGFNDSADAAELLTRLQDLLGAAPVLLFVDNALTATQLDGLLPCGLITSFQPGSRLVVTSRFAELRDSASYRVSVPQRLSCWVSQGPAMRMGPMPDGWHLRKPSIQQHLPPTGHNVQAPGAQVQPAEQRSIAPAVPAVRWPRGRRRQYVLWWGLFLDAGPAGLEDKVISACGGLPMALELAGGFLTEEGNANAWQVRSGYSRDHGDVARLLLSMSTCRAKQGRDYRTASIRGLTQRLPAAAGQVPARTSVSLASGLMPGIAASGYAIPPQWRRTGEAVGGPKVARLKLVARWKLGGACAVHAPSATRQWSQQQHATIQRKRSEMGCGCRRASFGGKARTTRQLAPACGPAQSSVFLPALRASCTRPVGRKLRSTLAFHSKVSRLAKALPTSLGGGGW